MRHLLLRHRWISALTATGAWIFVAFLGLSQDSLGRVSIIGFGLVCCGYVWFLSWVLDDHKPKPEVEIEDISDIASAARAAEKQFADELQAIVTTPVDLTTERWHRLGSSLNCRINGLYPAHSGTAVVVTSESTFKLVRDNEEVQIVITKRDLPDNSELHLESRRRIAITTKRLLQHRKRIVQVPLAVVGLYLLVAWFFQIYNDFIELLVLMVCVFVLYRQVKRVSNEEKKNSQVFPLGELSALLSDLKKFIEAELDKGSHFERLEPNGAGEFPAGPLGKGHC